MYRDIEVQCIRDTIHLIHREPDPAGGRAERHELARLSVDDAERLVKLIQSALPQAREAARKNAQESLVKAQRDLEVAQMSVRAAEQRIARLKEAVSA